MAVSQFSDDDTTSVAPAAPSTSPTATSSPVPTEQVTETPASTPIPTPTSTPTPSPTSTPTPVPALWSAGASGDEVRDLQSRLKQIGWYGEKITGEFDDLTVTAVEGFQDKRELPVTGEVDQQTWDRLVDMTREPTEDEKHNRLTPGPAILGPGDSGDDVRELQARLKQIGWYAGDVTPHYGDITTAAVKGFQVKREIPETGEVDQRTWDRLKEMTSKPTDDDMHNVEPEPEPKKDEKKKKKKDKDDAEDDDGDEWQDDTPAGIDPRCTTGRALCIDKTTNTMRWMVGGDVKTTLDVRFGSELTPTREGAFSVGWKSRNHVSSLYDTPMPYAMFFSGGQAVHYSPDFAANGYNGASHGCVNVRDKGAIASLFDKVSVGDKVIVYRS